MEHRFIHQFSLRSRAVMTVTEESGKLLLWIKWHGRMSRKFLKRYRWWKSTCIQSVMEISPSEYNYILGEDPIEEHLKYLWKKSR